MAERGIAPPDAARTAQRVIPTKHSIQVHPIHAVAFQHRPAGGLTLKLPLLD
jgi:hypothetical protein